MARITTCKVKGTDKSMTKVVIPEEGLASAVEKLAGFITANGGYVSKKILAEELSSAISQAQCTSMREKLGLVSEAAPKAGDKVVEFKM